MNDVELKCIIVIMIGVAILQHILYYYQKKECDEIRRERNKIRSDFEQLRYDNKENLFRYIRKEKEALQKVDELDIYLKAIIIKFKNEEIEINDDDMEKAKRGNLYIESSYLKLAKRIKVLFKENYLRENNNDNT